MKLLLFTKLPEQEKLKVVFSLPHFKNCLFLNAINRSVNISNNKSINQGMTNNYFMEKCIPTAAPVLNVVFSPLRASPKNKKTASENFMPQASENNETTILEIMSKNLLEGDECGSSLNSKLSAKIKAKFDTFLCIKSEVGTELEELLCSEKDDSVQTATLKLRATVTHVQNCKSNYNLIKICSDMNNSLQSEKYIFQIFVIG